jgi:hypothetical protein
MLLAAERARMLRDEHDDDWFRNPRAIEQLRAEARLAPSAIADEAELERGMAALVSELSSKL